MMGLWRAYSIILALFVLVGVFVVLAARATAGRLTSLAALNEDVLEVDLVADNVDLVVDHA